MFDLSFCVSSGVNMEMLGRRALWEVGLNYGHGTGHGVGNYFGVHECMLFFPGYSEPMLLYEILNSLRLLSPCHIIPTSVKAL